MKTEVIMKRKLFNMDISQKSKTEFFSATDLIKAGNLWRLQNGKELFNFNEWLRTKSTKIFISHLIEKFGEVKINAKGKNMHTWVHPFLFIDIALAISPDLKIEVYSWLYDHLLKYRNDSGDSYNKMTGTLYNNITNKSEFKKKIAESANTIRKVCNVIDWQNADEKQLKLRDKIHENISLLCDVLKDVDMAIDIGIKKALNN